MHSATSAMRHSVTNIIIRQPTNCVARLFVSPCWSVDTSFVIRLKISPCEVVLKYFCSTRLIFSESSPLMR